MVTPALKEKLEGAKEKFTGFSFSQRLLSNERGFFGVGSIIAVIIGITVAAIVLSSFEWVMGWIAKQLSLGKLMVHIPPFDPAGLGLVTFPELTPADTQGLFHASTIMSDLYMLFVTVSFAVLAIAFVAIGLSYALEGFNVLPPNTANKLLSESVLVLILIFLFPWFFNIGAVALNGLNEGMIMHEGDTDYQEMARYVAGSAGDFPGLTLNVPTTDIPLAGGLIERGTSGLAGLVLAVATLSSLMICLAAGTFKLLACGTFAVAFPLLITMRLIPITRNLANKLMQGLIGVLMASLVIALFFRFSWGLLHAMEQGVMRWAVAVATMVAAAGALTITARVFYGITRMISGTMGRSVAMSAAGYMATGATAGLGGAAGMGMGAKKAFGGAGAGGAGGAARVMGRSAMAGAAAGGPGKSIAGSVGKGLGAGKQAANLQLGKELPVTGDIETTTGNITKQLEGHAENAGRLGGNARGNAIGQGKALADRGMDNIRDERLVDWYGKNTMEGYNPDTDREALRQQVSPDEIREGLKGAVSNMKDQVPQGDERAYGGTGGGGGSANERAYAALGAFSRGNLKMDYQKEFGGGKGE